MTDNVFESLASQERQRAAGVSTSTDTTFDAIAEQERQRQQALAAQLNRAVAVNPDTYNTQRKAAESLGLPAFVAETTPNITLQAQAQKIQTDVAGNPVLQKAYGVEDFAKLAHDDSSTLKTIGQFFTDTGGSMKAGLFNASKGSAGVFRAGLEFAAPVLDPLESVTAIGGNPLRRLAEGFAMLGDAAGATAKAATPKTDGVISGGFQSGVQSLTQNTLALPMAFFPGGQSAALAMMTANTGGQSYQDAREKGLSMSQALPFAASQAAIEYATEKMPLDALIGGIKAGAPFLQTLVKQMALEIPGEQVATILQDLNEWAVLNPGKTFKSYLEERPNAAAQTLVATIVGTGGNVVIAKGIETATKKLMGDAYDAGLADTHAQQLQDAFKTATDSKLRERNPDEFRTLVQAMADNTDGAPKEVYVDAEVLNQLAPEVLAQLPGVAAQMADALAANDVVAIPVGDVLTVAPGTPLEAMLIEHARIGDVRAMSQFEAKEAGAKAQEFLAQESQRVIAQAVDQQATQESHDRVKQTLLERLNTVGRDRPAVNEVDSTIYASLYTTLAHNMGINKATGKAFTPEEAFALHGVNIVGQASPGEGLTQITPEQAMGTNMPLELPADPLFAEAVGNTPGAQVTENGLLIDLVRFQKPGQEGAQAIRTGVFYLPAGSANAKHYKTGKTGYGGTEKMTGQTLLRRPLFVKGATGGKAPEAAYDAVKGKGAMKKLDAAVMSVVSERGGMNKMEDGLLRERVQQFLKENGGEPGLAREIIQNSKQGNTLRYALQEHVIAHAVRAAGYDAVVGYSRGKAGANISEVFDVREQTFPANGMDSQVHEVFNQTEVSAAEAAGFDTSTVYYHGTTAKDFKSFRYGKDGVDELGPGIYFTSDPWYAGAWAGRDLQERGRIIPVYLKKGDIFDLSVMRHAYSGVQAEQHEKVWVPLAQRILDRHNGNYAGWTDVTELAYRVRDLGRSQLNELLYLAGYVGAENRYSQIPGQVVVFDARNIRSPNAKFNPKKADSSDLLAQGPRGTFNPKTFELALNENSNMSTVHHEMGHAYLEIITKIASEPNAPQAIVDQVERFLKWQKIPDLATWQAMTLDQKRPHHEALAENYEHYLLTGKAPSLELQPLFRSLKRYMLNAYKSLKAFFASNPNVEQTLPPEMVQFYDRMLATEEQIAQAEEVAGLLPQEDATAEALEKLTARSLRDLKWTVNARNKAIKALQAEAKELRKGVEAQVTAEVDAMPEFAAKAALDKIRKDTKLQPSDAQMETIAEQYQFTSVDEMLQSIAAVGNRAEVIEGLADKRMLEEHGDLIDQRAIEEAANEAVHNEARARSLATELRSQAEALNPRVQTGTASNGAKVTVNAIVEAAKQFAANVVARTKIIDLKSKAWQHTAAERRAGKRWQEATTKGKTAEAIQAKQDQVLNNAAAKAALEAAASMRKMLEYVNKFEKESVRKKLPPEYLDQIDQLLEAIDLRVSTTGKEIGRRKSLAQWVAAQQALGLDPILPARLLENMALTSFKEMTVDEFTDLTETIKNIEHLGRLKSKLLAAKDKREFDIIAEEIAQSIIANGGKALPTRLEPDGRISQFFKGAWADHRKLNSLVHQMDGGVDNGPFYRAFVRSMNDAGAAENVMLEKATEALAKIYAPIEALPGGISGGKLFIPEIRNSLSRAGRLSVALNWGNEQNRQRVMDGDAWTEAQVGAILKTLSPIELQFVNDVWAHIDGYWPEIKAKQLRVSGVVEDKVEAVPFETVAADGTVVQMRGGYYPIKYDGDRSIKADLNEAKERASEIMRGAVARPTTRRGHTQARVDEVVGRPVKKDLSVITQHVNQVVHDLAWHEWFIDANRLLNDSRIQGAIRDHYGPEIARTMMDNVNAIAVGDTNNQGQVDKLLLLMRSNVTRSIMGASLTTAMLQPFGLTQSMARIGVMPVLKGAGRWAGDAMHMESTVDWINGKSEFMRLRSKTFNRELREISQRVQGKSKLARVVDTSLFMLMQKMQMVADVPTWVGQYEKALAGGVDESTAVALADEAVLASQGGGTTKDLAAIQRNNPFLTQFYSYFSTTLQLVAEKTALTDFKNPRAVAGWLGDMALLTVIPAILPALITHALKGGGGDDDPEEWAKRLAKWQASYLLGMFVGLRELPTLWSPFDYGGPPAAKVLNDAKRLVQQAGQGEVDDPAVIATIGFMGTALGLPTTQLLRSYKGWKAWDEGDAPASSILFGPPPKD